MKTWIFKSIFAALALFFVTSCFIPASKEGYLLNFERFVNDVERNSSKFSKKDWRWADKRFDKYSRSWYEKYKEELTVGEHVKVASLKVRFRAIRETDHAARLLNENVKKELEKLGRDVNKYVDENLGRDVDKIVKGAREIGDSAARVIDDVLKEIRRKKEGN